MSDRGDASRRSPSGLTSLPRTGGHRSAAGPPARRWRPGSPGPELGCDDGLGHWRARADAVADAGDLLALRPHDDVAVRRALGPGELAGWSILMPMSTASSPRWRRDQAHAGLRDHRVHRLEKPGPPASPPPQPALSRSAGPGLPGGCRAAELPEACSSARLLQRDLLGQFHRPPGPT
jgi:hypothetical protein